MMTLVKQPNESILYDMDFTGLSRIGIDTIMGISTVNVVPTGLILTGETHDGNAIAQFRASGGTDGITYKIDVVVLTKMGDTLEGNGKIQVINL